jgi:hypothetical protein
MQPYSIDFRQKISEKENEEIQVKRVDFWEKIRDIRVEDLIFIDESGVNLAMLRL